MFKNLSNIANLMRTAGQLGERMSALKQRMDGVRVRGRACEGEWEVCVELNGLGVVQTVDLSPSLFDPQLKTVAQRLILEAMNQAVMQAKELHIQAIKELTHGVEIPGLDKILEEMAR